MVGRKWSRIRRRPVLLLPGQQRTKSRCAAGIILINGGLKSMDDESSPNAPSSPATAKTETDTSGETPSPLAHAGDLSAEVDRKDLLSSVARVVSPPPLLSLLEDVLDERIVPAKFLNTAVSELDKHDDDGEISIEIRSLSEAFVMAEATIDAELDAFMSMATLAGSNDADDADDVSTTHGTTEEVEISEKERQELEEVDEVAMLLRQNSTCSRYAYAFGTRTCRTTSGASETSNPPPLTPTRRGIASIPLSSPASHSFDVMSNTRIHQRAVSRLKRQYCYLAATRNATALSDVGASGSDSGESIAESELVANVLLLQAERMAKKVTRPYDGTASPKCTLSPLKGSVDLSPFSLSISPIRTVSATADRSAAKASPEQLAAIERCLREGEALTSASTKIPQRQEDFSVATDFAAPAPIPFLPTDNEMVGSSGSEDQTPSRFAPRFALPCLNSPKIKETISENREEDDDDEENEVGDTLSPLPPSSLAKSDRWAKYKKKGLKGRNAASSFKSIRGIANTGKNLQARRQLPNQHFSIFQENLVSMKQEEALREKKEQFIEDARNKKLYNRFVMLKAAAATKSGCAGTVNGAWLKEGQWFIDFDTFDTDSDEEIQGDERGLGIEVSTKKFAANLVGGFRKHIVQGGHFGVPKRIVSRSAMVKHDILGDRRHTDNRWC